jgi:hypothetical protein
MSNALMGKTIGFIDEAIASEELITNNNSLMKMVRTMATFSQQVSISSSLSLIGGSIADVMTITGGYIIIDALFGVVVTVCSNNACTVAFGIDPTVGAADIPISSGVDVDSAAVGDTLWVDGDATASVLMDQATNPALFPAYSFLCPVGGLDMDLANSNLTTGAIDLILVWRACSPEAYVTVA